MSHKKFTELYENIISVYLRMYRAPVIYNPQINIENKTYQWQLPQALYNKNLNKEEFAKFD